VEPYALVQRWGWWYLVGYCRLRQGVRSFRIDRIVALALLDEAFLPPAGFDIHAYLATEPAATAQQRVQLRFGPAAAAVAWEQRYQWANIVTEADGGVLVTLVTPDLEWAVSTVLAYSGLAVAVAPPELRDLVRERAQVVAAQYE
jgi:predicted DNA-binding transcriptional regulator YafY